jgi:hypothetical protein
MVRAVGEDASEQKVIDDVAKFGWHCVNILPDGEYGPYSFSIGLHHTYDHPEFIIVGLPSNIAHEIINIAVEAIQRTQPIDLSKPTDELLKAYSCCFVEVPQSAYRDYVGFGLWFYEGAKFPLFQIVWPSRAGEFPWHPNAPAAFRDNQPVLGYASKGT